MTDKVYQVRCGIDGYIVENKQGNWEFSFPKLIRNFDELMKAVKKQGEKYYWITETNKELDNKEYVEISNTSKVGKSMPRWNKRGMEVLTEAFLKL